MTNNIISDSLLLSNRIQVREDFRTQIRQLIQAADKAFQLNSKEMKHIFRQEMRDIFREEVGDIQEREELGVFHNDE